MSSHAAYKTGRSIPFLETDLGFQEHGDLSLQEAQGFNVLGNGSVGAKGRGPS